MDVLTINEVALGECDVDDPEVFMNDWANSGDLDVDYIAGRLMHDAASNLG